MNPFEGYKITSIYGYRIHPVDKVWKMHNGIDLVKPDKSSILAFVGGEVVHARMGVDGTGIPSAMGNVVAVKDKYGSLHLYAHLYSISVKVGDKIEAGKEVGKQGTTGTSTASHLHYEIRSKSSPSFGNGFAVEPTAYLYEYRERALTIVRDDLIILCQDEYQRSKGLTLDRKTMSKEWCHLMAETLRMFKG